MDRAFVPKMKVAFVTAALAASLGSECCAYSVVRGNLDREPPAHPLDEEYPVNTLDVKAPKARQIMYEEGVPDVFPVNQPGEQYLPDSHNDYAEYVIVNSPNTTVRNFGTNANKNVLINNARGPVRVEFSTHAPSTATLKTFDNTGTAMVEGQPPSLA
ncbi:hypothetical protein TGMAS_271850 [Toxoplasma gondii MAS]|uniref:Transmembrane protein n=1 Tax=Toxoplasma gondii MAS TaxID=943118 RepID=A0A086QWE2_TOXGO|nr:hypothetical protein TGMAS_271850 [Toxoplasma gondii MAS]